jgi:hypothetical protein
MFEQTSNTAQLLNHHSISAGNKRTPAKNFPAYVLGSGQASYCRLLREIRFLSFSKANGNPFPRRVRLSCVLFAFHAFCLWNARSAAPSIPESRGLKPFVRMVVGVAQLPSCHEEPASCSGEIVGR